VRGTWSPTAGEEAAERITIGGLLRTEVNSPGPQQTALLKAALSHPFGLGGTRMLGRVALLNPSARHRATANRPSIWLLPLLRG
jgi:hypothetical protein